MRSRYSRRALVAALLLGLAASAPASGQSVERFTADGAASITKFYGEHAGDRPDMVVDVAITAITSAPPRCARRECLRIICVLTFSSSVEVPFQRSPWPGPRH